MRIILASASPRRRELLTLMGITDFEIVPASGEASPAPGTSPAETVKEISRCKALDVFTRNRDALVIAADTLVYLEGEPLGKPRDAEDAKNMLRRLSGRGHTVYTGVTVMSAAGVESECEATDVFFRGMTDGEIDFYVASGEPLDKAGAYGAQGLGAAFVRRIEGDFFNVMGLPVQRLWLMLKNAGLDLTKAKGE